MKAYRSLAMMLAAASLAACGQKAEISGTVAEAPGSEIIVKKLDINVYSVLDTISTAPDGSFRYKVNVRKGQPEFVYLFHGDTRIAGLLLETGEKAVVSADTLGNYSVTGSEGSEKLAEVDKAYSRFLADIYSATEGPEMAKIYLDHYRACVQYVIENPYSLTTVPVLFERLSDVSPVFSQTTDALFFKNAADSLKTVYPESRYVLALEQEAERRMNQLEIENRVRAAGEASFPDIVMPDINGKERSLSSVDARVILLHFWDASNAGQKMMNIDTLLPIYEDFHDRGFEIFAVCVSPDKAEWGTVVNAQKLPWINVNDGRGAASGAAALYNVTSTPTSMLIVDGEISNLQLKGKAGLRRELGRLLRR